MSHYHLDIIISQEEVEIIKEQFKTFVEESGGMCVRVSAEDEDVEPSKELEEVICKIFFNLIMTLYSGKFKGVN